MLGDSRSERDTQWSGTVDVRNWPRWFHNVFRLFVVMTEENEMFRSIGMQTERQISDDRIVDTVANE